MFLFHILIVHSDGFHSDILNHLCVPCVFVCKRGMGVRGVVLH